jgi:hypothetical protein
MLCGALQSALKWKEVASNTYRNYKAHMASSFDSLRHLKATCILETKRHRAQFV